MPAAWPKSSASPRVLVPSGAGVGSAIGFLRAPVGYEVVRSLYQRFSSFDVPAVNALLADMAAEATRLLPRAASARRSRKRAWPTCAMSARAMKSPCRCRRGRLTANDVAAIRAAYDDAYTRFYDRPVPGSDVEIMSYAVQVTTTPAHLARLRREPAPDWIGGRPPRAGRLRAPRHQPVRDTITGEVSDWPIHDRTALRRGTRSSARRSSPKTKPPRWSPLAGRHTSTGSAISN